MKNISHPWRHAHFSKAEKLRIGALLFAAALAIVVGIAIYHAHHEPLSVLCARGSAEDIYSCWLTNLQRITEKEGAVAALDQLRGLFDPSSDPSSASFCHALTHIVGASAYEAYAAHKTFTFSPEMGECSYGFYHGFIDTMLAETGNYVEATKFCDELVQGDDPQNIRGECFHGIGHGVVDSHIPSEWADPQEVLARSLQVCTLTADTKSHLFNCADGVYNGIRNVYLAHEYGTSLAAVNVEDLCKESPAEYRSICYNYMPTLFFDITQKDFKNALSMVVRYTDLQYESIAVAGVANWAAASKTLAPADGLSACRTLSADLEQGCIDGYALGLVQYGIPGKEYADAMRFCSLPDIGPTEAKNCFENTQGELERKFSSADLVRFCNIYAPSQNVACAGVFYSG